ncbi:glutathione S-transferase N-terminal domain-containing protein [Candidatus Laterigemmans baculatus]|uniref:glutathione S-transferase N-terminal domain-containing protein n=1 Tax=Candidatus Laterigemmans baculatus TaxID=2770505 RepID=UPI0013D925B2|nr:glutathione S-transferase N-terminal domain-containing protein [Candidatus Laterigemmans baculatus]
MLTLYRKDGCSVCDEVAARLRELRLAHRTLRIEDETPPGELPAEAQPPILWDDGASYTGSEAIAEHLQRLASLKDRWQQHGADACYCDPDGEIL